jgi:CubicO group peptidase (beta-lactamase class C family)
VIDDLQIDGTVRPGFEEVREEFETNFRERGDVGASLAVYVRGELVVDLWGGIADPATGRPWERGTVGLVYSATKGATAVLVNRLAEQGVLDPDAPVSRYWPEFGAEGKDRITVAQLLSHQAGLPMPSEPLTRDELLAGTPVVEAPTPHAATWNAPSVYAAELPAANGITNARSLARLYAACVGEVDGRRVLSGAALDRARVEQVRGPDGVIIGESRFGIGFQLSTQAAPLLGEGSFGHAGAGGALGFGDVSSEVGFGYVQNQLGASLTGEPRTAAVIDALRRALA